MVADKNIKISEEIKKYLDSIKIVSRESYDDVLRRVFKITKEKK